MDRRTWIAVVLCFLIFVGWQKFYIEPRLPKTNTSQIAPSGTPVSAVSSVKDNKNTSFSRPTDKQQNQTLITSDFKGNEAVELSNGSKFFSNWRLAEYKKSQKDKSPVDLSSISFEEQTGLGELAFDIQEYAYLSTVYGTLTQTTGGARWDYEDKNVKIVRNYTLTEEKSVVLVDLQVLFKSLKPNYAFISISSKGSPDDNEKQDRQLLYYLNNTVERHMLDDLKPAQEIYGSPNWIGAQSRYFLFSIVNENKDAKGLLQSLGEHKGKISLVYPVSTNQFGLKLKTYFGPKEVNLLKKIDPTLESTVDFGWFTAVAYPILVVMKKIKEWVKNWGIAIILLTLLIKLLTFPLTYKSMASMKKMAALQPQLNALKEKHANDKEALNRELLTFMRTNGYNPMSGCLPMLIQMPVFFALYRVLYSSIELYQAPFFGWITDLSLKDPYYITPVLLTGFMYLQQKLTPSTISDPMQAKMMQWMPVFFGVLMINLPSGLTIYMLVNAIASIFQQMYLNKKLNHVQ